ncbi:hypothetical protein PF010_g27467 [Phytophthora fragariae]|uniref:Uncharacterized protein n=1 Tax=Phytophthora fragariae TaxID=53985 RepID=A0A6A3IEA9_9STRA|nr:hypothetical protein PF003_g28759 [Phytophthora fragariae]KAE8979762.1 hypothetical protein PF011_g22711 [Phytophthora fragariae]KAE9067411.1 hypothetical protein PF010_g27467 [Phytophthora fragariae]
MIQTANEVTGVSGSREAVTAGDRTGSGAERRFDVGGEAEAVIGTTDATGGDWTTGKAVNDDAGARGE